MKLLLDTHAFVWWDGSPERLSSAALAACREPANEILLSVVSVWELQIKKQLRKFDFVRPLAEIIAEQQQINDVRVLPVELHHVLALDDLPNHHKDPFDRLLAAQAIARKVQPLSAKMPQFHDIQSVLSGDCRNVASFFSVPPTAAA